MRGHDAKDAGGAGRQRNLSCHQKMVLKYVEANPVRTNLVASANCGRKRGTEPSSDNPFQYTGRENDATGFIYYRARYYSPMLQRFISEDPIGFSGGDVNLYGYVGNDPVMVVDPTGTAAFWYHFIDGFAVGFAVGYFTDSSFLSGLRTGYALGKVATAPDANENKKIPEFHATRNNLRELPQNAINNSLNLACEQWQSGTMQGMGNAIHIWRDVATHAGSYFPDPNATALDYIKHIVQRDLLPGGSFSSVIAQRLFNVQTSK